MRRQYIKSERKRTAFFLAAACLSVTLAGCGETEDEDALSEVIPVEAQMPIAGTLTLENEFIGTVSPEEAVYVIPMVTAEVVSTDIQVGDTVTAGQELCKLDTEAAELQLASAEAQYNSASAGVAAAEVGYEIAQAQYDSTVAQLDVQNEQTQRQKDLTMYQMQMQIDSINNGIDDINNQLGDLEESKKDAENQRGALSNAQKSANANVGLALQAYNAAAEAAGLGAAKMKYQEAVAAVTALDMPGVTGDKTAAVEAMKNAKEKLDQINKELEPYEKELQAAQAAATQAASASAQLEAGIDQIEDGEKQLRNTLEDTYQSKEQAEAVMNMTEAQLNIDTQDVQDIGKRTAALGVESAAAQVNSAKVGAEGAKLGIESAEYQLDMYTLTAPIDGVIEAVNVKEHDFASPQSPAFVISNKKTMTVTFGVSEGIRATLRVGQKITVDRNGKLYDAVITEIGSMIDQNTGLFVIKSCVNTPDDSLLTGCSVKVTAQTYSQTDAILIPYDAVYYDNSQPYVYVAVDGFAKRIDVETGIFDEETITVLDGLSTEDVLITSWSANLREGAEISVQMKSEGESDAGETAGGE